ncbi:sugar-phosphatase [Frateuria aurantia]
MIKLIAIDMDGTLLNPAHEITPRVRASVIAARERGIRIVLATGRPYTGVRPYLHELGLDEGEHFCITSNGSVVQQAATGEIWVESTLSHAEFVRFEGLAAQLGVHSHAISQGLMITTNRDVSAHTVKDAYMTHTPLRIRQLDELPPATRYQKLMWVGEPARLDAAIARIPPGALDGYTAVKSADDYFEILSKDAGKGPALKRLSERLGVEPAEIMAIGDHENDLSMFRFVGTAVAMGNAIDAVKAVARHVTRSNTHDGVAHAIESYVLNV